MEQGKVVQNDTVERVLIDPQNERVKRFLNSALYLARSGMRCFLSR
jgi:hypothetical protein